MEAYPVGGGVREEGHGARGEATLLVTEVHLFHHQPIPSSGRQAGRAGARGARQFSGAVGRERRWGVRGLYLEGAAAGGSAGSRGQEGRGDGEESEDGDGLHGWYCRGEREMGSGEGKEEEEGRGPSVGRHPPSLRLLGGTNAVLPGLLKLWGEGTGHEGCKWGGGGAKGRVGGDGERPGGGKRGRAGLGTSFSPARRRSHLTLTFLPSKPLTRPLAPLTKPILARRIHFITE